MLFSLLSFGFCGAAFYVMAPLDLFDADQNLQYPDKLNGWLSRLHAAQVDGLMVDVWWGLVETTEQNYKWTGYTTLFQMCKSNGLKIVSVMSCHQCGGNVGDVCNIPIPDFVLSSSVAPFFKDRPGRIDDECISFQTIH
jgi:beta-amylase